MPATNRSCIRSWRLPLERRARPRICSTHTFSRSSLPSRFLLRVLRPRQPESSAVNFFHFSALLQFLQHARQIAPPAMLQAHAVRDVPDARRLRDRRQMREHQLCSNFVRDGRFSWFVGMALAGCHTVSHRLTDLHARGKTCFPCDTRFFLSSNACQGSVSSSLSRSSTTILPSASRSSAGAYGPSSSRLHQFPVSRFVRKSVNQE